MVNETVTLSVSDSNSTRNTDSNTHDTTSCQDSEIDWIKHDWEKGYRLISGKAIFVTPYSLFMTNCDPKKYIKNITNNFAWNGWNDHVDELRCTSPWTAGIYCAGPETVWVCGTQRSHYRVHKNSTSTDHCLEPFQSSKYPHILPNIHSNAILYTPRSSTWSPTIGFWIKFCMHFSYPIDILVLLRCVLKHTQFFPSEREREFHTRIKIYYYYYYYYYFINFKNYYCLFTLSMFQNIND